jgi:hypothetical protein
LVLVVPEEHITPVTAQQDQTLFLVLLHQPVAVRVQELHLLAIAEGLEGVVLAALLMLAVLEIPQQLLQAKVITVVQVLFTVLAAAVAQELRVLRQLEILAATAEMELHQALADHQLLTLEAAGAAA